MVPGIAASIIAGVCLGLLTAILPGMHPNNLAEVANGLQEPMAFLAMLYPFSSVISMVVSALVFIPDSRTFAVPLPAQQLVKKGKAGYAVYLIALSAIIAAGITLIVSPLLSQAYLLFRPIGEFAIVFVVGFSAYSIAIDRRPWAGMAYFLLAGLLGIVALGMLDNPFLSIFSGLFGMAGLLNMDKESRTRKIEFGKEQWTKALEAIRKNWHIIAAAVLLAFFAEFLPGISTESQLALIAISLINSPTQMLILVAGIGSAHQISSMVALSSIGATRTGMSATMAGFGIPGSAELGIALGGICLASVCAIAFSRHIKELDMKTLRIVAIAYVVLVNLIANGINGVLFMAGFTVIGMIPYRLGTKRSLGMGAIIVPVLVGRFFG